MAATQAAGVSQLRARVGTGARYRARSYRALARRSQIVRPTRHSTLEGCRDRVDTLALVPSSSDSISLYRRHRPGSFDEVVGQQHVVRTLRSAVEQGKVHHAYLFVGSRGTGKTSMAK